MYTELRNDDVIKDPIERHLFVGTKDNNENSPPPEGIEAVVEWDESRIFRKYVLDSDVVIYDLMSSSFEEADHVIKALKTSEYSQDKVLILISSVMSWANTPPKVKKVLEDGEEEQEEPEDEEPPEEEPDDEEPAEEPPEEEPNEDAPPKPVVLTFKEKDFHLRVPGPRFRHLKTLETLALSAVKAQPKLRVYVLLAGVLYGSGERIFYDHFKRAWLQAPRKLPMIGKGDNLVPTIHVIDLARLVKRVVSNRPENYYIFAVDRTRNPTQKRLVEAISRGIGTAEVESVSFDDVKQHDWAEVLTLDLKMRSSDVMKDGEPPEDAEDPEEAAKRLKFPWHCEKGILKNALALNVEFNQKRGVRPVKILITGPPASGKSYYAHKLAQYYNVPHITIKDILGLIPTLKGEFGDELRTFIEEKKDAIVEEFDNREDKQPGETLNRDSLVIRLPNKYLYKLAKLKLVENACRNRGYVLDGYPRSFRDAQYVFLKRVFKETKNDDGDIEVEEPEENDDIEEDEVDEDGNVKEKNFAKYSPDVSLMPDSIVLLDGDQDNIMRRVRELPEQSLAGTHWNHADLIRRFKQYRKDTNSPIGDPALADFFENWAVGVCRERCEDPERKLMEGFKIFVERKGRPFNYMTFDEDAEKLRIQQVDDRAKDRVATQQENIEREEFVERQWRKQKEDYTKVRFEQIKEQERDLLDSKSQPIRAYLVDNVVPILTEGLIEVCKNQPEDPVDFLAEYLFRESKNIQGNNVNFYS